MTLIPQTSAANYLGITKDTDLKFHNHIVLLKHKISRTIGILSKLRHFLPQSALLKIYYALIHSQLRYGLHIWGSTFPSYINKLKSFQNKAVKTMGGGSSPESPTKFLNKFSILKLNDLFKMEVAKIVHSHFTNNLPSKLSKIFALTKNISSRATRATESSRNTLNIPRYSTVRLQRCIKQRWSPRGHILKSLALASKPQVLVNCPVLGSRTALFFEWLKFCTSAEKCFSRPFFWRSTEKKF